MTGGGYDPASGRPPGDSEARYAALDRFGTTNGRHPYPSPGALMAVAGR